MVSLLTMVVRSFHFDINCCSLRSRYAAPQNYKLYSQCVELTKDQYENLLLDVNRNELYLLKLIDDLNVYMITHKIQYKNHYKILKRKIDAIKEYKLEKESDYYKYGRSGLL